MDAIPRTPPGPSAGPPSETKEKGVTAVDRALKIVEGFRDGERSLSLQELAARTALHKATIIRLIASLERFGYVLRVAPGEYALGPAFLHFGGLYRSSFQLSDHVVPALRSLVRLGGETAAFFIRDGDMRICLYKVESTSALRSHLKEGDRRPLLPGGTGKILLAFSEDAAEHDAPELADIRKTYITFNAGERHAEIASLAVPVFGQDNALEGAMSFSGPVAHFTPEKVRELTAPLFETAARLTQQLGGDAAPFQARLKP
ncbi:MAG: IclR family transcriptional regulator [Rhodospirillales bacterium]